MRPKRPKKMRPKRPAGLSGGSWKCCEPATSRTPGPGLKVVLGLVLCLRARDPSLATGGTIGGSKLGIGPQLLVHEAIYRSGKPFWVRLPCFEPQPIPPIFGKYHSRFKIILANTSCLYRWRLISTLPTPTPSRYMSCPTLSRLPGPRHIPKSVSTNSAGFLGSSA